MPAAGRRIKFQGMEAIGSEAPRRIVQDVLRPHKAVLRQLLSDLRPAVLLLHHVEHPPLFRLLYSLYFKVLQNDYPHLP